MIASSFERAGSLEAAGVEFIDENGGGPGVRLRKPPPSRSGENRRCRFLQNEPNFCLRVRPETSGRIAKFSEHEAD
jgi:hypothetical protein